MHTDTQKVMKFFKEITQIPHCSSNYEQLKHFLVEFAKDRGYCVEVDRADNILISIKEPKVCLQAHYDMVCVGKAPDIEPFVKDGWIYAKESSLGADNGMAIAMMLNLIDEGVEAEYLFTADEEIGLIGAKALELKPKSKRLLNLDYESEGIVCIGCAGGVDIIGNITLEEIDFNGKCYEVSVSGLPGGHSGVDIDKGIPSAIKVLAKYLKEWGIDELVSFDGGERRNSIPANAKATVYASKPPISSDTLQIKEIKADKKALKDGLKIIDYLNSFKHGVREFDNKLNIPYTSINLAIISTNDNQITVTLSARAMDNEALEKLATETIEQMQKIGFETKREDEYPAWKPIESDFTQEVCQAVREQFGDCKKEAIHAGLECGILTEKLPYIRAVSIGPTIQNPHSIRERVNIDSVEHTYKVVEKIINRFNSN